MEKEMLGQLMLLLNNFKKKKHQFQPEATKWHSEGWTCSVHTEEDFYPAVLAQDLKFG